MVNISDAYEIDNPTLEAVDAALEAENVGRYGSISAGNIGEPCWRKLWFSERWLLKGKLKASSIKIFSSGHLQEDIQAERLRKVEGIQLWTEDPKEPGKQISFSLWNNHFRGFLDGIIKGLLEAPKTPHVWEHKEVNQKNFNKLKKLLKTEDEKEVLKLWNINYYGQAQIYMHMLELKRHFLTVSTGGGRESISVRSNLNNKVAKQFIKKAEQIIFSDTPPERISEKPDFYMCSWCDYQNICHAKTGLDSLNIIPNCRNCAHVTPVKEGGWRCDNVCSSRSEQVMKEKKQQETPCDKHIFNPKIFEQNFTYTVQCISTAGDFEITYIKNDKMKSAFLNRSGGGSFLESCNAK